MSEIKNPDIPEVKLPEAEGYKEIKADYMTGDEARAFWDEKFNQDEVNESNLQEVLDSYIDDIRKYSDVPETIPENPIAVSDLKHVPPEENAPKREQFDNTEFKKELKRQWEQANGMAWPKYTEDVYITNNRGVQVKIREADNDYDAHHIQPLCLGGKNEASNLTPLRADVHFDSRGVHKEGSPYDQLNKMLGGAE